MFKSEFLDMSKIVQSCKIARLFEAVEGHGGTIRFVGGAVRDTLAGLSGFDLDLATDLSPEELSEACLDNGLKTIPVGLKTATVGVIIDGKVLEVASLRRSIRTENGKHSFEFTDDWSADAARRDLTINAVYADLRGNVFDYYNGISDLEKGIVRFIGNPEDRINEDPLRIMRFFRFYARFGKAPVDADSLNACIRLKGLLRNLAIERVRDELFKILITPNAAAAMKLIYENDILAYFLPRAKHLDALIRLSKLVEDVQYKGNFLRRLFVLYQPNTAQAENMANSLRFTKKQKETFVRWAKIDVKPEYLNTSKTRLQFIYRYGKQFCLDKVLLGAAIFGYQNIDVRMILRQIEEAIMPIFPLMGRDISARGIYNPKQIGKIMERLEQQWIDADFTLTREELLTEIKR